jgi:hypothetical protein
VLDDVGVDPSRSQTPITSSTVCRIARCIASTASRPCVAATSSRDAAKPDDSQPPFRLEAPIRELALEDDDLERRVGALELVCRPQPGETTADDAQCRFTVAIQRGPACTGMRTCQSASRSRRLVLGPLGACGSPANVNVLRASAHNL